MLLLILLRLWSPLGKDRKTALHREIYHRVHATKDRYLLDMEDAALLNTYSRLEMYFPHGMHTPPAVKRNTSMMLKFARTCLLLAKNKKISARIFDEFRGRVLQKKQSV